MSYDGGDSNTVAVHLYFVVLYCSNRIASVLSVLLLCVSAPTCTQFRALPTHDVSPGPATTRGLVAEGCVLEVRLPHIHVAAELLGELGAVDETALADLRVLFFFLHI